MLGPNDEPVRVQVFKLDDLVIPVVERGLFAVEIRPMVTVDQIVAVLDIPGVDRGERAINAHGNARVPGGLRETPGSLWNEGN